jgi:copper transport protein
MIERIKMFMRMQLLAVGAIIGVMIASPAGALAHAHYDHSDPAAGAAVSAPPSTVTIWFTEELQPQDSWIHVLDANGARVDMDDSAILANDETALKVSLRPGLGVGSYTVSWQNLSQDGDGLAGSFAFGIGQAPTSTGSNEMDDDDDMDHDHGGDSDHMH